MQSGHPASGNQARLELVGVERLEEVVISTGLHPFDDLIVSALARDEDHVYAATVGFGTYALAEFEARLAGHHPVTDNDVGVKCSERVPRLAAVGHGRAFVAKALQRHPR